MSVAACWADAACEADGSLIWAVVSAPPELVPPALSGLASLAALAWISALLSAAMVWFAGLCWVRPDVLSDFESLPAFFPESGAFCPPWSVSAGPVVAEFSNCWNGEDASGPPAAPESWVCDFWNTFPPDAILDEEIAATNDPVVATGHPKQGSDQKLSPLSLMFLCV